MEKKKKRNNLELAEFITKVTLVIYFVICSALLISLLVTSFKFNHLPWLYGFLLCLGPSILFVVLSFFLPIENVKKGMSVKSAVFRSISCVLKYILIICIPLIGINFPDLFDNWTMLATTLFGPVLVIGAKIILAIIISKKNKTDIKNSQNSIKF